MEMPIETKRGPGQPRKRDDERRITLRADRALLDRAGELAEAVGISQNLWVELSLDLATAMIDRGRAEVEALDPQLVELSRRAGNGIGAILPLTRGGLVAAMAHLRAGMIDLLVQDRNMAESTGLPAGHYTALYPAEGALNLDTMPMEGWLALLIDVMEFWSEAKDGKE